jgi:hypothetical protein
VDWNVRRAASCILPCRENHGRAIAQAKAQSPSTTRNPRTNEKACTRQAFEFGRELLRGPRYGKYSIAEVTCCFSRRSNFDAPV